MDYKEYVKEFNSKLARIKLSSDYETGTEKMAFNAPAYKDDIDEMELNIRANEGMGDFKIYQPIRDFYLASISCDFGWQYLKHKDKDRIICGSGHIKSIYEIFEPDEMGIGNNPESEYRIFDYFDINCCICLKFSKKTNEPELYYLDKKNNKTYLLKLSFNEYMECLSETLGLVYWRELFVDSDEIHPSKETITIFLDNLRIINPNADFHKYKKTMNIEFRNSGDTLLNY